MNYYGLIHCVIVLSATLILNGCASTTQVSELSSEMRNLSHKIDQINSNIDILEPEVEQAKNEAIRANKRLDNQISFYKK